MMMFYTKTPPKVIHKDEEIQPWNSDQSNIINLILESAEVQPHKPKKVTFNEPTQEKVRPYRLLKDGHSYNFYTNLRKYQKKKTEDFFSKKDVNFIEKNIKGISEEFTHFQQQSPHALVDKMIQDKNQRSKMMHHEYSSTIEPINLSLISQYQQKKTENRHRQKMFQNFIRFQEQNSRKGSFKQVTNDETLENIEEQGRFDSDKYQKLLKMREGLRKRNLKSCDESRQKMDNTLNILENCKSSKLASTEKAGFLLAPKSSRAVRSRSIHARKEIKGNEDSNSNFKPKIERNKLYSSHQNRIKLSLNAFN